MYLSGIFFQLQVLVADFNSLDQFFIKNLHVRDTGKNVFDQCVKMHAIWSSQLWKSIQPQSPDGQLGLRF